MKMEKLFLLFSGYLEPILSVDCIHERRERTEVEVKQWREKALK